MTIAIQLALIIFFSVIGISFVIGLKNAIIRLYITLQGPFFGATSQERIEDLIKLVNIHPGDKVVDLGSGDGRVLIALAKKYDITAVGYEIDPKYVALSKKLIKEQKLEKKITIIDHSFWEADLSSFDVVVIYCVPRFLKRIEQKFQSELKKNARIYSIFFRFPTWKITQERGDIRFYKVPKS